MGNTGLDYIGRNHEENKVNVAPFHWDPVDCDNHVCLWHVYQQENVPLNVTKLIIRKCNQEPTKKAGYIHVTSSTGSPLVIIPFASLDLHTSCVVKQTYNSCITRRKTNNILTRQLIRIYMMWTINCLTKFWYGTWELYSSKTAAYKTLNEKENGDISKFYHWYSTSHLLICIKIWIWIKKYNI